jgi:hypothetical protein
MNELETRDSTLARRREEIKLFLGKESEKLRAGGGPGYDLVTEYRKTKKNFSPLVPIAIFLVVVFFVGASWMVTTAINSQSRKVSVDIQAFEDLNLKDLLDQAKNTDAQLKAALNELAALEYEMNAELARIREERTAALALLEGLSPAEQKRRRAAIESDTAARERAVRAKYASRIAEKRIAVTALQERAAAYDARSVEEARKQQEILNNQEQLFQMEKANLTASYEERITAMDAALKAEKAEGASRLNKTIAELTARYNPTWTDERGKALSSAKADAPRPPLEALPEAAPRGSPVGVEELRAAAARYEQLHFLIGRLRETSYVNSVPGALAAADNSAAELVKSYTKVVTDAAAAARARDERIARLEEAVSRERARQESYSYAFSGFARDENEAGFVIDGRDPERVLLYVDPIFRFSDGTTAWVFRAADVQVAELKLRKDGDSVLARVERLESGFALQPFDRILLKLTDKAGTGE